MPEELVQVSLAFKKDNPEKSVSFGTNAVDCIKNGIEKNFAAFAGILHPQIFITKPLVKNTNGGKIQLSALFHCWRSSLCIGFSIVPVVKYFQPLHLLLKQFCVAKHHNIQS